MLNVEVNVLLIDTADKFCFEEFLEEVKLVRLVGLVGLVKLV